MSSAAKKTLLQAATCLLIPTLTAALLYGVRTHLGWLQPFELKAYDLMLRLRARVPATAAPIVIVGISDKDIQTMGHYPVSDEELATALQHLAALEPAAIGVDIYRDIEVPPGRPLYNEILQRHTNIIGVELFGTAELSIPGPPVLRGTGRIGFVDWPIDSDGILRRALMFVDDPERFATSFGVLLASRYLNQSGVLPDENQVTHIGRASIKPFSRNDGSYVDADDGGYQFLMDYRANAHFTTFSFTEAFRGQLTPQQVRGKIVLVGVIAESVKDFFFTPLGGREYGVTLHARAVDQLIRAANGQRMLRVWPDWLETAWTWLWSLSGGVLGYFVRAPVRFVLASLAGVLMLFLICLGLFLDDLWVPLLPPAAAWLVSAAVVTSYMSYIEKEQRAILNELFSRHVSRDVAKALWEQRDQILDRGRLRAQRITATVLFTDLKGFASIAEKLPPAQVMDWLNNYLQALSDVVAEHHGVVNKYTGDGLMALFGVPVPSTTSDQQQGDARNAVNCALAIRRKLKDLNASWSAAGDNTAQMRIGVHSGELVAGSLGSVERMEYTVIGDAVNIASRLESYDKSLMDDDITDGRCRILISEATASLIGAGYRTRSIGSLRLAGREQEVGVYGICGTVNALSDVGSLSAAQKATAASTSVAGAPKEIT